VVRLIPGIFNLATLTHLRMLGVVAEEMLHLSLAGNVLRAVGGSPKLYDPNIIPSYPMLMPGRIPDLELQLRKMTKENLQTFIDVRSSSAFVLCSMLILQTPGGVAYGTRS
jgi:hypothetical protein